MKNIYIHLFFKIMAKKCTLVSVYEVPTPIAVSPFQPVFFIRGRGEMSRTIVGPVWLRGWVAAVEIFFFGELC